MPFQKGNQLAKNRTSTKNLLPVIRQRVLRTLNKRLTIDRTLKDIPTVDLLKFAQSIMPKDVNIQVAPNIEYISQCPRPTLSTTIDDVKAITSDVVNDKATDDVNINATHSIDVVDNVNGIDDVDVVDVATTDDVHSIVDYDTNENDNVIISNDMTSIDTVHNNIIDESEEKKET